MKNTRATRSARTNHLCIAVCKEELHALAAINGEFPQVARSNLAATLLLLGALTYWRTRQTAPTLDRDQLLASVQLEQARQSASQP